MPQMAGEEKEPRKRQDFACDRGKRVATFESLSDKARYFAPLQREEWNRSFI